MNALVIGGTGPTGPFIVDGLLKRGYDVTLFHRGTHEVDLPKEVEHIHGDPHFKETIETSLSGRKFDLVICMYGRLRYIAEVMKGRTDRFIAIGGMVVYKGIFRPEHNPDGIPVPIGEDAPLETDPERNRFSYLMAVSEQTVMEAHRQGQYQGVVFRYPMVYGPRQLGPREWCILRRILDGRKQIIIADGGLTLETRGYAENMAHGVLLAVDKPEQSAGQIYNIGDVELLTFRRWIEHIFKIMNYDGELVEMPALMARPSRPYSGRTHHRVLDLTKIKTELGYREAVSVEEAIRRTVQWYLEHRPQPGGEEERQLKDPFDYEAEDRFIGAYRKSMDEILQIDYTRERFRHPYPHPKEPNRPRDEAGR